MKKGKNAMEKAKISLKQLFTMIVLFELGSALLVGLGLEAKQDSWIAILLGVMSGLLLFLVYGYLFRRYPTLPLTGYIRAILGKYIGWPIGLLYVVYFIYLASRVLRDFGELLLTSVLPHTPLLVINTLMILTVMYTLYKGIEVISRTSEIFFGALILLGIVGNTFIAFSGLIDVRNLLPVFENGFSTVLKGYLQTFTFPFGEMIVFTMILPFVNVPHLAVKTGIYGMIFSGFLLTLASITVIVILGVDMAARSTFPLLTMIGKINIAELIQRLDPIVVLTLIIGGYSKIAVYFYVAVAGTADLFKLEKQSVIVIPVGVVIVLSSMMIASNYSEHITEGLKIVPLYLHLPFQLGIPLMLFFVAIFRKRFRRSGADKQSGAAHK